MKTIEIDRLEKLGFKNLGEKARKLHERKRKLAVAYEFFRFVRSGKVDEFNAKLKAKTIKGKEPYDATWQRMEFCAVENYDKVPPDHVLIALEAAQEKKCFDSFEIAYIANVKDPILFGRISGCSDRFFIDQWDDDVKIEDILLAHEG